MKYLVSVPQVWYQDKEVEAKNEEEAKAIAFEDFRDLDREDGSEFIGNIAPDNGTYDYLVMSLEDEKDNSCEPSSAGEES